MSDSFVSPLLSLPRTLKRIISVIIDVGFCALSVWLAYYLRLGEFVFLNGEPMVPVAVAVAVAIPIFAACGLYRAVLRYGGIQVAWTTVRACAAFGVIYAAIFTAYGVNDVPRTVGIIQPLLLFAMVFLSRALASHWLGGAYGKLGQSAPSSRAMIYGAGTAGQQLSVVLRNSGTMEVEGFIDDDVNLHGRTVAGLPVYSSKQIDTVLSRLDVQRVLLAIPSATRARRNEIIARLRDVSVEVRTLPSVLELANGEIKVQDLRELSIEDLLRREAVPSDTERLSSRIAGQTVLITGAGGSIGSELCRQVLALRPGRLLLVDSSEYALYSIHRELQSLSLPGCEIVPLLASVTDVERMREVMAIWRPQQVYHAAAFKHVPLVEHNVVEGVRNNVFGTLTVAQLAAEHGVANFVLVSTDKAVRPTNTMGASKRLAEMVLQGLARQEVPTCFSMVRFGNVLGSSGSVVPLFREQIRKGGPVTVTHPEMTRYFMTIPEAAQLVMQAGAMAQGGEVFLLDMGEPVRIVDLARSIIELSGLTVRDTPNPHGDIEIKSIGLRPGEKLYEELLIGNNPQPTPHPRIMKGVEKFLPWPKLRTCLDELGEHIEARNVAAVRALLQELVEEFSPMGELVDWAFLAARKRAGPHRGSHEAYIAQAG